jgi:GrpB-like predicted nucleotidyltransferase (UPF0157 family)
MVGLSRNEVALEAHDSSWRETYREEAQRLRKLVGDRVEAIEHVGSTAVPGDSREANHRRAGRRR